LTAYSSSQQTAASHAADRKLHLMIDHRTQEAVAASMSEQYVLDRRQLAGRLRGVAGEVAEVLGDGAYDFQDCYRAIHERGARAVIPPQRRARLRGGAEFGDRNAAVLRGREVGRDGWKKEAGYHRPGEGVERPAVLRTDGAAFYYLESSSLRHLLLLEKELFERRPRSKGKARTTGLRPGDGM
jgi:hypothetical protein